MTVEVTNVHICYVYIFLESCMFIKLILIM